jgi:hypothetical protein
VVATPISFSAGVDSLLAVIDPGNTKQGTRAFPVGVNTRDLVMKGSETYHDLFTRVVSGPLGGDVSKCAVEEDLAVFLGVTWDDYSVIQRCHVVALKTENCDLAYYLSHGKKHREVVYFRLDLDFRTGMIFTHPYPHIHCNPLDAPRYSANGWASPNAIVDFLEYLYVELYHPQWVLWAERIWGQHWASKKRSASTNPYRRIIQAFHDSQYPVLLGYTSEIAQLKGLLRTAKDDLCPFRINTVRRDLMAYPTG